MHALTSLALSTGISCALWQLVCDVTNIGLIGYAGFCGTTTYFAFPTGYEEGVKKIPKCFASNMSGVLVALLAIYVNNKFDGGVVLSVFMTGFISFLMVFFYRLNSYMHYMAAAFMGCFTTFAAGGDLMVIPSMVLGYVVALGCDYGGKFLDKHFGKEK